MKRRLCLFCLIALSMFLSLTIFAERKKSPSPLKMTVEEEADVIVRGKVHKKEQTSNYQILTIKNSSIIYQNKQIHGLKLILYDKQFHKAAIGNEVQASGSFSYFEPAKNPGQFDQRFYYRKQGILGKLWTNRMVVTNEKEAKVRERLWRLKLQWSHMLLETLGEENGGLMCAILLGDKSALSDEIKELYQKSGIGHIMAISGLHISFLGLFVYRLLRRIGVPFGVAGAVSVLFLLLYILMVGASVSALRAFLMFLIRIGGEVTGRVYDQKTSLSVAAVLVILWQPLSFFDAGFLLSFGAILGILLLVPAFSILFPEAPKLAKTAFASMGIQLFLLPILLWFYYEMPLYSVPVNLMILPFVSLLLAGGICGSAVFLFSETIGSILLGGSGLMFAGYRFLCAWSLKLPYARIVLGKPKWYQVGIYYGILFLFLFLIHRKGERGLEMKKKWRRRAILLLLPLMVCSILSKNEEKGKVRLTMLDVGQGDGIYMQGPSGVHYLIDGGSSDVKSVGKYRIEPFLKSEGVGTLDYVFLTHGDADHVNGVEEMIERMELGIRIRHLVLPFTAEKEETFARLEKTAEEKGIQVYRMKQGETWEEEALKITCMQPAPDGAYESENAASLVLHVSYLETDILLTGDVEGAGEKELLHRVKGKPYDILKVAHHGSKNSTSEEFLRRIRPTVALISAGAENPYGHPSKETMERLQSANSRIYTTIEKGAISLVSDGQEIQIRTYN